MRKSTNPMRAFFLLLLCHTLLAQSPDRGERHEFVIANFHTESGAVLPQARVVYGTYGHLNAEKSNAVLRIAPPLVISGDQVDWAVERIGTALRQDLA